MYKVGAGDRNGIPEASAEIDITFAMTKPSKNAAYNDQKIFDVVSSPAAAAGSTQVPAAPVPARSPGSDAASVPARAPGPAVRTARPPRIRSVTTQQWAPQPDQNYQTATGQPPIQAPATCQQWTAPPGMDDEKGQAPRGSHGQERHGPAPAVTAPPSTGPRPGAPAFRPGVSPILTRRGTSHAHP